MYFFWIKNLLKKRKKGLTSSEIYWILKSKQGEEISQDRIRRMLRKMWKKGWVKRDYVMREKDTDKTGGNPCFPVYEYKIRVK